MRKMNKRCCGLAMIVAAGMTSAGAYAQSNVTISGYLDEGIYRGFEGAYQVGTIQRSNLAISGVEDLGGGMRATFRLSTRFDMDTGGLEGAGSKPFWQDESTVGLAGSLGSVRIGRALSAMWAQDWKFDPWANFNRIASPAWYMWHYNTATDRYSNNGTGEYGRMSNAIFYDTPTIGGFTLHLSGQAERTLAPTTNVPQGRGYSGSLNYDSNTLSGMLAYERNGSKDRVTFLALKYNFGPAAIMGAYDDSRTADSASKSRVATLGATYQIGATTLKAGYGRQKLDTYLNNFYSLGADYALSKRTTLYASLGRKSYESEKSASSFGVGMAHSF